MQRYLIFVLFLLSLTACRTEPAPPMNPAIYTAAVGTARARLTKLASTPRAQQTEFVAQKNPTSEIDAIYTAAVGTAKARLTKLSTNKKPGEQQTPTRTPSEIDAVYTAAVSTVLAQLTEMAAQTPRPTATCAWQALTPTPTPAEEEPSPLCTATPKE